MNGRIHGLALLVLLALATPTHAAEPPAPPCKNGATTCKPWERDWRNTPLPPGSVVTDQGVIYAPSPSPIVNFLYNWQTLIAGAAAIFGGWIAYRAGMIQAAATRESAATQIAATAAEVKISDAAAADAIRREVMEFTKFITGNLEICTHINTRAQVPRHDLPMMMKTGVRSVIYPALADRIGRHPFPLQVVPFYTRIAEAEALIEITAKGPAHHMPVTPDLAQTIAESLITALQLARSIVNHVPNPELEQQVIDVTQKNIDEALKTAQQNFPNAESFT